jgi:hypothetical protein
MKWFRFYSEALHDPKVQQLRPELFKFWVNCLCLANEQPDRGTLPTVAEIAFILRMKRPVVERFCVELVVNELIHVAADDGPLKLQRSESEPSLKLHWSESEPSVTVQWSFTTRFLIHQWAARQPSSDDSSKRVKAYRQRTSKDSTPPDVTLHVTPCNGTRNALEGELELELNPLPLKGDPLTTNSPSRQPADLADVAAAERLLGSDPRTQHLALELGRTHNLPEWVEVPGWRFLRAARRLLSPEVSDAKRGRWAYFVGIVRGLSEAEREEPAEAAKKETASERKRREFKEGIERMKAKEREERDRGDR